MDKQAAKLYFQQLNEFFQSNKDELNRLDAAVGDGDHGSTLSRGMKAGYEATKGSDSQCAELFVEAAKAFQDATGGASGILFSGIFQGIGNSGKGCETLTLNHVYEGLQFAVGQIKIIGEASVGDKTMLDALAPAVEELNRVKASKEDTALEQVVQAAQKGASATIGMAARMGRSRYVADGGKGHIDPGAQSVVYLLTILHQCWSNPFRSEI